ncbi:MAG: polysaccharide deacetylase [Clostridiales bacterium]|nr:polysaccharide deacetylase [Clostridiales bacterium]
MVIALLIIIPTVGCFVLMAQVHSLQGQLESLQPSLPPGSEGESSNGDIPAANEGEDEQKDAGEQNVAGNDLAANISADGPLYQGKYPWLYVEKASAYVPVTEKTVFLTFDDGPTEYTPQILDTLADKGAHATFFVVYRDGENAEAIYKRIVNEGHTLAIHSKTHIYSYIYRSIDDYLDDFAGIAEPLETITGVKPDIFRFPGGSRNEYINPIRSELIAEMTRRGYTHYDWDVTSASADAKATKESIYSYVTSGVSGEDRQSAIVLLHDAGPAAAAVVAALPDIIDSLKASGYKFGVLNNKVKPPQTN